MRLKVFHAPNMGAAMAMVRDELGPEALILASRDVDGGVELTAAQEAAALEADRPDASGGEQLSASLVATMPSHAGLFRTPRPAGPPPSVLEPATPELLSFPAALRERPYRPAPDISRAGTLRWHGVPADIAARLHGGDLTDAIAGEFRFGPLPTAPGAPPLLLVGPPGAGKTLTAARLVTRLKLSGCAAVVVTADGRRAGAAEQLAAFTRLLELPLIVADTPSQLARAMTRRTGGQPALVDMPGLNPFEPEDQQFLRECQDAVGGEIVLVLPAGLDPAEAAELADGFHSLGARHLVATRLDQSRRLGGVLAAAAAGLALTVAGISPAVADGLVPLTPSLLAKRLAQARPSHAVPTAPPTPCAALSERASLEPKRSS